jgi:hypothetical protein
VLELLTAQVAEPVLATAQAAVLVRVIVRVVPGLETVPAAAPAKIKSVTAAHHHGQVAVPRVEDSAGVAEITREQAATEAAKAWAAAG